MISIQRRVSTFPLWSFRIVCLGHDSTQLAMRLAGSSGRRQSINTAKLLLLRSFVLTPSKRLTLGLARPAQSAQKPLGWCCTTRSGRRRAPCLGTLANGAARRHRDAKPRAENGAASARAFAGGKTVLREAAFAYRAEPVQITMMRKERAHRGRLQNREPVERAHERALRRSWRSPR